MHILSLFYCGFHTTRYLVFVEFFAVAFPLLLLFRPQRYFKYDTSFAYFGLVLLLSVLFSVILLPSFSGIKWDGAEYLLLGREMTGSDNSNAPYWLAPTYSSVLAIGLTLFGESNIRIIQFYYYNLYNILIYLIALKVTGKRKVAFTAAIANFFMPINITWSLSFYADVYGNILIFILCLFIFEYYDRSRRMDSVSFRRSKRSFEQSAYGMTFFPPLLWRMKALAFPRS